MTHTTAHSCDMSTTGVDAHLAWCRTRGLREGTQTQRRRAIARFTTTTGIDPLEASRDVVEAWWNGLTATAGARAVELSHIRAYIQWAVRYDLIDGDTTVRIDRPRVPRRLPRPISQANLERAIATADARMRLMLALGAYCGLRTAEIAAVEWGHIIDSPDGQILSIPEGKGGHGRLVPLHDTVAAALQLVPGIRRGRIIRRMDGQLGPILPARVSREINDHLHGLGIPDTAHALRHFYGTHVYRASHDLLLTGGLMGHTNVNTTSGYVAWDSSRARDAISQLPRAT